MERKRRGGFTLIELTIVVVIAGVIVTLGGLTFSSYSQRSSARRAAQVFAQDLIAARGFAIRSQESVVLHVYESTLWYEVSTQSTGTEIVRRRFAGSSADIDLSGVTLEMTGDSLVFSSRGMADMTGAGGGAPLGTATFSSGAITYTVSFNGMGASKIDET